MKSKNNHLQNILFFYKSLFSIAKLSLSKLIILQLMLILGVAATCLMPLILNIMFGPALNQHNIKFLFILYAILIFSYLIMMISAIVQGNIASKIGASFAGSIRRDLFDFIQSKPKYKKHYRDKIISFFANNLNTIEQTSIHICWSVFRSFIVGIICFLLLFYVNWRIAVLTILLLLLTYISKTFIFRDKLNYSKELRQSEVELLGYLEEEISMKEAIRILRLRDYRKQIFMSLLNRMTKFIILYNKYIIYLTIRSSTSVQLVIFLILGISAYFIIQNYMTMGQLIAFLILLANVSKSADYISNQLPKMLEGADKLREIKQYLSEGSISKPRGKFILHPLRQGIEFDSVSYSHKKINVLSCISLKIQANQTVAFVGPSGSGKTSMLRILLGDISPSSGKILFDGIEIQRINIDSLLTQIGLVTQEPKVFTTSIKENIRFGKLNATDEEIFFSSKQAGIHDEIIRLPKGYDTILDESQRLSGGQLQRIVIARALISNPTILCLDEATSALDPISSSQIDETIKRLSSNKTIIISTHRLHSVEYADFIFVLEHGHLKECGTHQQLINKNGLYTHLWDKQTGIILSKDMSQAKIPPVWLKHIKIFEEMDISHLAQFADKFEIEHFEKNKVIFKEGDIGDKFYIIIAGIVEVRTFNLITKKPKTKTTLIDGDHFGEIALMYNIPRSATIKTKASCIMLSLSSQQFHILLEKLPKAIVQKIEDAAKIILKSKNNYLI